MTGIEKAVEAAGSQPKLAALIGVSKQAVQQWVAQGYVPVDRVVAIEAETGVARSELVEPKLADLFTTPFQGE